MDRFLELVRRVKEAQDKATELLLADRFEEVKVYMRRDALLIEQEQALHVERFTDNATEQGGLPELHR